MDLDELKKEYEKVKEERRTYMAEYVAMGSLATRKISKLWSAKIDSCDRRLLKLKYEMKLLEKKDEVNDNEGEGC